MIPLDLDKTYTYADYLTWNFEERVELIKGKIFQMTPAPLRKHQLISSNLHGEFFALVKPQQTCHVYHAPFDVRLPRKGATPEEVIVTVVQPDLCIICDASKLDDKGCLGAPDLVVEILSPSTSKKDLTDKYAAYEEAGVREYWVVYPGEHLVHVYLLNEEGQYTAPAIYGEEDTVPVHIFNNTVAVPLSEIFG